VDLPRDPTAWTYATVVEAIRRCHWEPAVLDFKEVLHPIKGSQESRNRNNDHIRQTAGAFANALGGHLVFGVRDPATDATASPESVAVGIPLADNLRKEFGDKLVGVLPPLDFEIGHIPLPGSHPTNTGLLVVQIPQSLLGAHMDPDGRFYRRDAKGANGLMDYSTVRDRFLAGADQQRKLRMLRLELHEFSRQVQHVPKPREQGPGTRSPYVWHSPERFDAQTVKALLVGTMDVLPPGLAEDIHLLATSAMRINQMLEAGQGERDDAITFGEAHAGIESRASSIEERLRQHFGPLPV